MQIFLTVLGTLLVVALGVLTVFFVQTLIQLKRTGRSVEVLADNLNTEVERFKDVAGSASHLAAAFGGTMSKGVALLLSFLKTANAFKGKGKGGSEAESSEG